MVTLSPVGKQAVKLSDRGTVDPHRAVLQQVLYRHAPQPQHLEQIGQQGLAVCNR